MLTDRQSEILSWIRRYVSENGYPPTIREIGKQFGIGSPNGVMCHLRAFEKKGLIVRGGGGRSRAYRVSVDSPGGSGELSALAEKVRNSAWLKVFREAGTARHSITGDDLRFVASQVDGLLSLLQDRCKTAAP